MISKLTAEQVWDFFSTVSMILISQDHYKGLIIEGKSMVRTWEGLPPYVQKQFEEVANTLNERGEENAIQGDPN